MERQEPFILLENNKGHFSNTTFSAGLPFSGKSHGTNCSYDYQNAWYYNRFPGSVVTTRLSFVTFVYRPFSYSDNNSVPVSVRSPQIEQSIADLRAERQEEIQKAVAAAHDEMSQLRRTIVAMREELESWRAQKQDAVQAALASSHDELGQLRATISALREQMEKMGYEKQQAVQAAVAHSADEIDQLRKTVQALRDELENERAKHNEERQGIRVQSRDETKHLEEMVSALREQLEHRNGR